MKKNTKVETTQKGQATTKKEQPENVKNDLNKIQSIRDDKKNNKTPVGKVTLMKETETRKKNREEQYRNFRINALKRRCERLKYSKEATEEFVKKLIEQLNAPKDYTIIVILSSNSMAMMSEAITNAKINYTHKSANTKKSSVSYFAFSGDKKLLEKLREIAPPDAKFHIYAKKAEPILHKQKKEVIKKPSNNTAEKKAAAKLARKTKNMRVHASDVYKDSKGRFHKRRKPSPRPNRGTNHTKMKIGKRAWMKAHSTKAILSLAERISKQKAIAIQMRSKKGSTGEKNTSTNTKKAA